MHAWTQLRGEIGSATKDNFERLALTLLRLSWPDLFRPPERDELDRAGIDLAAGLAGRHLACVIQCKGFYAAEQLTAANYRQIKKSIDKFIASPFTCDEYVLFHNRDSRNQSLGAKISQDLARIIDSGKCRKAKVWDRQTFVRDFSKLLRKHLAVRLAESSERTLARMSRMFDFGDLYVPTVPVSEKRLTLVRGKPPTIAPVAAAELREPAKLVSSAAATRWTLLMGLFGTGKSTAALRAAHHTRRLVIYVRCADMSPREGGVGTNSIMETILRSLALFEDFDEEARNRLVRLSGTLLRAALVDEENAALLILDGLDENRQYATPRGVMTLSSALAELRCPVLFTTREEHFNATFANHDALLDDHSVKGGSRRDARVLLLEPWGDEQVREFLDAAAEQAPKGCPALVDLRARLDAGTIAPRELQLLRHPLFLQMITALAGNGEEAGTTTASVLSRWTYFKMRRDLEADRVLPAEVYDAADFVTKMGAALEAVAGSMIEQKNGKFALSESTNEATAIEAVQAVFPGQAQNVLTVTSASLLVPTGPRVSGRVSLMFSHRVLQEYFLARHLLATGRDPAGFPADVIELHRQLQP